MTPIRLLAFSLLLICLGTGLWLFSQESTSGDDPAIRLPEAGEDAFLTGLPQDLRQITIEHPKFGQRVRAELSDDGRWRISEPLHDVAEPATLQAIMSALWTRDWQEAPDNWQSQSEADLGLEAPEIVGEVKYADGSTESFRVGAADAGGRWFACTRDEELIALGNTAVVQLRRPGQQWRDHRVQPFGIGVTRLEWTPKDGNRLVIERRGQKWYLQEPVQGLLDEGAVPHLARMLGARASGLGDTPPNAADPVDRHGVLQIHATDGSELRLELWPRGIISSDRDYLIAMEFADFRLLSMETEALLSRRVIDFNAEQVQSIRAEHGDRSQVFRLRTEGWMAVNSQEFDDEVGATVGSLLGHAAGLMRTERLPLPDGPPAGRLLYSISTSPKERGSTVLRWWVAEDGTILVGAGIADYVTPSTVNFEAGVSNLLDRF